LAQVGGQARVVGLAQRALVAGDERVAAVEHGAFAGGREDADGAVAIGADQLDDLVGALGREDRIAVHGAVGAGGLGELGVKAGLLGGGRAGVGQGAGAARDLGAVQGLLHRALAHLVDVALAVGAGDFVALGAVGEHADEALVLHGAAVVGQL